MNLLIISHTPHYWRGEQLVGWGPTVREIDQLAKMFDQVWHLAVLYDGEAPASSLPYLAKNVSLLPIRPAGGETLSAKLDVVRAYFGYWSAINKAVGSLGAHDLIHVRCPANISLLALLYLFLSRRIKHRWVKYAGNWQPTHEDVLTYKLQRWMLKLNLPRGVVTVNGKWKDQPPHIYSFLNPSLISAQPVQLECTHPKKLTEPLQILFVGRVETAKGCGRVLSIAGMLRERNVDFNLHIIGDGEERSRFELLADEMGLAGRICFYGWMSHSALVPSYKKAHFLLLPTSASEGWPKVLSEGMADGVVPLAGAVSSIPQILQECHTGMALDPLDTEAFVKAILAYWNDPARWERESQAAREAAHRFTYDEYLNHLQLMFAKHWGIRI